MSLRPLWIIICKMNDLEFMISVVFYSALNVLVDKCEALNSWSSFFFKGKQKKFKGESSFIEKKFGQVVKPIEPS